MTEQSFAVSLTAFQVLYARKLVPPSCLSFRYEKELYSICKIFLMDDDVTQFCAEAQLPPAVEAV